ncbi:30S ribosomal protein S17 [Diplonema papillatum]|nr:30S ribosomal protein S17 [Diplonema papillatum]
MSVVRRTRVLLGYPMGLDFSKRPGEGFTARRQDNIRNVMQLKPYVERGMPLLYPRWYEDSQENVDHNYILFNRPQSHSEKIGVVVETLKSTAIISCRYFVRYKNFGKVVARVQRCWAHDEDNACVIGDVVMIKKTARRGKYKSFLVQSILEPDLDARERLKKDLPAQNKPELPNYVTGWKPIFDFSRDNRVNDEEASRAEELATDISGTDADYDGGLADRAGKDVWAFLDEEFMTDQFAAAQEEPAAEGDADEEDAYEPDELPERP